MREVLTNRKRTPPQSLESVPERVTITEVCCEYSEIPKLYKVVVRYRRGDGQMVTETRRFERIKAARLFAHRAIKGLKGRNGW